MRCEDVKELLIDYLKEDDLPCPRELVTRHLARCSQCRDEARELQGFFRLFRSLPVLTPSGGFLERVEANAREREREQASGARHWANITPFVPCEQFALNLLPYCKDEIPQEKRIVVATHLKHCDKCRGEMEEIKETFSQFKALPRIEPSPDFLQRVERAIARILEHERQKPTRILRRPPEPTPWSEAMRRFRIAWQVSPFWMASAFGHAAVLLIALLILFWPSGGTTGPVVEVDGPTPTPEAEPVPPNLAPPFAAPRERELARVTGQGELDAGPLPSIRLRLDELAGREPVAIAFPGEGTRPEREWTGPDAIAIETTPAPISPEIVAKRGLAERRLFGAGPDSFADSTDLALAWLARRQRPNGSWPDGTGLHSDVGITALALLAFLGNGHDSHLDGIYRQTVRDGIGYLAERQEPGSGLIGSSEERFFLRDHVLATLALGEDLLNVYRAGGLLLAREEELKATLVRALEFLRANQGATTGSWSGDVTTSAWALIALRTANAAARYLPEAADLWSESAYWPTFEWFLSRGGPEGMIGPEGTQRSLLETAATMFSWQLVYGPRSSYLARAEQWTQGFLGRQPDPAQLAGLAPEARRAVLEYWFFASYALYNYRAGNGPRHWERWRDKLHLALVPQQDDGAARPEFRHSWAFDGPMDTLDDRVYPTAMAALTLEVCYRYDWLGSE